MLVVSKWARSNDARATLYRKGAIAWIKATLYRKWSNFPDVNACIVMSCCEQETMHVDGQAYHKVDASENSLRLVPKVIIQVNNFPYPNQQKNHFLPDSHIVCPLVPSDILSDSITKPSMMSFARGACGICIDAASLLAAAAAAGVAADAGIVAFSDNFDSLRWSTLLFSSVEILLSIFSEIRDGET